MPGFLSCLKLTVSTWPFSFLIKSLVMDELLNFSLPQFPLIGNNDFLKHNLQCFQKNPYG